jgi:hypothetical protein
MVLEITKWKKEKKIQHCTPKQLVTAECPTVESFFLSIQASKYNKPTNQSKESENGFSFFVRVVLFKKNGSAFPSVKFLVCSPFFFFSFVCLGLEMETQKPLEESEFDSLCEKAAKTLLEADFSLFFCFFFFFVFVHSLFHFVPSAARQWSWLVERQWFGSGALA